jgi:glycosyltransferase involved in cell wall biosynthesis
MNCDILFVLIFLDLGTKFLAMTITLLITTYNKPDFLSLTLQSLRRQSQMPDELVIADDGSDPATRRVVDEYSNRIPVPIKYVWQEDKGFRKSKVINKAIAAAFGDYIIQIDGDIMMHDKFISDHVRLARKNSFVKGSRIRLNPKYTAELCINKILPRYISIFSHGILKNREKVVRLHWLGVLFSRFYGRKVTAIGCNMAYWRDDVIAVNGYDEHYEGWGCEDDDLCKRLSAYGCKSFKPLRMCLCYHLWHKEADKSHLDAACTYRDSQAKHNIIRCENGISQYLNG